MRKLTEADLHKKIKSWDEENTYILHGITPKYIWVERGDGDFFTFHNGEAWEVVEGIHRCPECPPAEPKKETMKHSPDVHDGQGQCSLCEWPENILSTLAQPKRKTILKTVEAKLNEFDIKFPNVGHERRLEETVDILIRVLDEKFKEME